MNKKEEEPPKVRLYTPEDFAKLFDVSPYVIRTLIRSGSIYESELVRLGRAVRVKHDAYERLVNGAGKKPKKGPTTDAELAKHRQERASESLRSRFGKK